MIPAEACFIVSASIDLITQWSVNNGAGRVFMSMLNIFGWILISVNISSEGVNTYLPAGVWQGPTTKRNWSGPSIILEPFISGTKRHHPMTWSQIWPPSTWNVYSSSNTTAFPSNSLETIRLDIDLSMPSLLTRVASILFSLFTVNVLWLYTIIFRSIIATFFAPICSLIASFKNFSYASGAGICMYSICRHTCFAKSLLVSLHALKWGRWLFNKNVMLVWLSPVPKMHSIGNKSPILRGKLEISVTDALTMSLVDKGLLIFV